MNSLMVKAFLLPRFGGAGGKTGARLNLDIMFICYDLQGIHQRLARNLRRRLSANGNWLPEGEWNSISKGTALRRDKERGL
jgi:hypothetical protein